MILQVTSPGDFPVNGPAYDGGSVYAVRVVQFSAGATIAFDSQKSTRKILGYFAYRNAREPGWQKIWLTGSCIIELATSPEESFGGSGVAGVAAIDANQNSVVVGPDAPGIAPTANPVNVGGIDPSGLVRRVLMDASGRLLLGTSRKVTYTASMRAVVGAAAVGGGDFGCIAHLAAATKRVEITRITVHVPNQANAAAGLATLNVRRSDGVTAIANGTLAAVARHDGADGTAECAPTTQIENVPGTPVGLTGGTLRDTMELDRFILAATETRFEWRPQLTDKPLILRAGVGEGWAFNLVVPGNFTGAFEFPVYVDFTEE